MLIAPIVNMETLLDSTNLFLNWLWRASWQGSVMIVLVLLAQGLFNKQITPRWRYTLWLLVVIRLALPWSMESQLSVFNWVSAQSATMLPAPQAEAPITEGDLESVATSTVSLAQQGLRIWLPALWLAGAGLLSACLFITSWRIGQKVRCERALTDSAVLNLLEDCKQEMGVRTPLTVLETSLVSSPSLFGFVRPRLLLPAGLTRNFSLPELRYVFLHELGHVKRGDILMNWLTTTLLVLHWFNPLVWFAFSRMRADRELACDALALAHTQGKENHNYGKTIIRLLEGFSRPAVAPGLVGILENKNQMKRRISMIAKFKKTNTWPLVAASLFAALALVSLTDAQTTPAAKGSDASASNKDSMPKIVATSPAVGDTDVSPSLNEITVTFDRDMAGGFSWTGGGPDYPPGAEGKKVHWRDKRTCVFPVKLAAGRYYRVGVNSTSYQNFRSAAGVPAKPSAIYFTTEGASAALKAKTAVPQIVSITPANGAKDVDPGLTELRLTFNVPMGGGFSWTGGGPEFPTIPDGKKPFWTEDHKTCVLPVELKSGSQYRLGLNSVSHKNFQSAGGVPLEPIVYTFRTKD